MPPKDPFSKKFPHDSEGLMNQMGPVLGARCSSMEPWSWFGFRFFAPGAVDEVGWVRWQAHQVALIPWQIDRAIRAKRSQTRTPGTTPGPTFGVGWTPRLSPRRFAVMRHPEKPTGPLYQHPPTGHQLRPLRALQPSKGDLLEGAGIGCVFLGGLTEGFSSDPFGSPNSSDPSDSTPPVVPGRPVVPAQGPRALDRGGSAV